MLVVHRSPLMTALIAYREVLEDHAADDCDCFECIPVGKDAGGTITEVSGKRGACRRCRAQAVLKEMDAELMPVTYAATVKL